MTASEGSYYISISKFLNIESHEYGGAVFGQFSTKTALHLLDNTFYKCFAQQGGAVYYISPLQSTFFSQKNCVAECSASNSFSGFFVALDQNLFYQNYINFTSFIQCSQTYDITTHTVCIYYGTVTLDCSNYTANKASQFSSVELCGSTQNFASFNTFVNNNGDNIVFGAQISHVFMSYSNFVHNNISDTGYILSFESNVNTITLENCIFIALGNCSLMNDYESQISTKDLSIDPLINISNVNLSVDPKIEVASTYKLKFVKAKYCHADDGVSRSFAIEITGIVFASLFIILLIITIIIFCCARSTTMQEVNLGPLKIK
ncbi:hypothetical protein TVAG_192490 [Trichomonas vaginalis G3]|uniref:Uncharacterized protein n=1 Tax=Trichomonas vaginalis (strain ATCC PRA-98 / G3) TaxID=412133 RepID=A2DGW3_TRIV3|nr:hypothetical protein TVAGG3_0318930 [Trichomonas vaginalis G3]EAY20273.1 hypothetical protein TVAG_192490 [Trichomonas vaginalis G3]KAI5529145.1 hypothetical protein TVAGG3_0318930 [Trichomonas vaginalis G3]|eukprot:XP_001581259.1 hypothetical protein [Trichomonas vaginalis G3]